MSIREFYLSTYPSDDLGCEIDPEATFEGLWDELEARGCAYSYIGVGDSIVRERCFERLSEIAEVDYNTVYDLWMSTCQ